MNSYFNGFNQYGNPAAKPANKSSTPTKYSGSSYSETNSSSHNLDMSVPHLHQQQNQPNLNPSSQSTSNHLYRSNSSSNLHVASNNTKTPLTQSTSQAQLNTSQSPQQRNSLSLCSTPQPPASKTPQPPTTPSHSYSSNNPSGIATANTAFNQNSSRASPIIQSQKTSSNSSKAAAIPNMYTNQPSGTNVYQQNPFTQNGVMPPAFPLLPNQPRVDLYAPPDFSSQYNHNQQHLNTNQYKSAHPQKSGQYDQVTNYMQSASQPSLQPAQNYFMNHHHQQSATYLPNLLAPSYQPKNDHQTSGLVQSQTAVETLHKAAKPAKADKKSSTKQAKKNQKTSSATTASSIGPVGQSGVTTNTTSSYSHQGSNNYEKMISVNAATALQHAAWYDLQAQLGTVQQNNQYNSQFQKSSLNPLFASSTISSTNTQKTAKVENVHRSGSIQSTNQHPNAYQNQGHNQYQHNGLNQGAQNYLAKDINSSSMARSSSNLDETLYNNRSAANSQHQDASSNLYNQYHHNLNQQHTLATNNQHFTNQNMNSQQQVHANNVQQSQFNPQSHHHNQFSHYQKNNNYGVAAAHHHLTNTALAFPHHSHHQAVAMNSLLANQFSNVSPFNWHPKI